jgi:ribosomal protein S6--L-glutamate ligase
MKNFQSFITEENVNDGDIQIAVLTKVSSKEKEVVSNQIKEYADKNKIPCHIVNTKKAWVSTNDIEKGLISVSDIKGDRVDFDISKTVVFVRAGVLDDEVGLALLSTFEKAGAFMINNRNGMATCDNKMSTYITFNQNGIQTPRTSIINNEESVQDAHKRIGGKFPVIVKTITGTQGIGVSIVNDYKSMISVIQSLWKFNADLLIQEFLEMDFDVRTIVVDGVIIASTKRIKPKEDFRSNIHRGADSVPYILSDNEKKLILDAYRTTGAYMVGVDHTIVNGKAYILECNGSPGIGSNFGNGDGKKTTNERLIEKILEHVGKVKSRFVGSTQTAGFVERLEIVGLGPYRAKFDTGNGTRASMFHVDKLEIKGKTAKWERDGKKFTNNIVGISRPVHVDQIDKRPIVLVDIKFNNTLYKDVPIGLTTRDSKSTFLINRELLTRFKVAVNPDRKFVLSSYIERGDKNDNDDRKPK